MKYSISLKESSISHFYFTESGLPPCIEVRISKYECESYGLALTILCDKLENMPDCGLILAKARNDLKNCKTNTGEFEYELPAEGADGEKRVLEIIVSAV